MSDINPAQHHRHFLLLEGELNDCLEYFFSLSQELVAPILVASDTQGLTRCVEQGYQDKAVKIIGSSKLKQVLGHSNQAVFVDIEQGLSANAISLISGTVQGGGIFVLALRDVSEWFIKEDLEQARYLPWPLTSVDAKPHFKQYFFDKLKRSCAEHIKLDSGQLPQAPLTKLATPRAPIIPTAEQIRLIDNIKDFAQSAMLLKQRLPQALSSRVILAHRGRGKSTALGMALAQLTQTNSKIRWIITGPNKASLAQLEKSYQDTLTVSCLPSFRFCSPDSLIHSPETLDILIVDEAAALPLPILKALLKTYKHLVFSSTDHGYEGVGRGFGIKFSDYLKDTNQDFKTLTLNEPIRWRKGDGLETFIDALLLLENHMLTPVSSHPDPLTFLQVPSGEWLKNQPDLNRCFSLLVSAHYQTSPDDIRWILDDPSVSTWLVKDSENLISTAIMTEEGQLDNDLALEVAQGTRRPRGHLLPQSLLAHEGHLDAGNYRYQRISRIATHPLSQGKGHASQLLDKIAETSQLAGIDFLCTSFAATHQVLNFWQKNGFICVRLGTSRDQASGCYSVMMLKALNPSAQLQANLYQRFYLSNIKLNLVRDYPDIDEKLSQKLLYQAPSSINSNSDANNFFQQAEHDKDKQDLALFAHHHRPYVTIRAQLYRCYIAKQVRLKGKIEEMGVGLLTEATMKPINEADFTQFKLHTKKSIDKALRQAVAHYLI